MSTIVEETIETETIAPFGVEADHPRNGDLMLQNVVGCRLRSAIDGTKCIVDQRPGKEGVETIPLDQVRGLGGFPRTPGMQIHVDSEKKTYSITDPLRDDDALCEKIGLWLKQKTAYSSDSRIRGVPTKKGKLDEHQIKTLCRELFWIVEAGAGRIVRGPNLTMEAIEKLPGRFLLNPGSLVPNLQPRFEDKWDDYIQQLSVAGG